MAFYSLEHRLQTVQSGAVNAQSPLAMEDIVEGIDIAISQSLEQINLVRRRMLRDYQTFSKKSFMHELACLLSVRWLS